MLTYILLFILFAILSFTDYLHSRILKKDIFIVIGGVFTFILIWGLGSLRWKTGTDWKAYFDSFYYFSELHAENFEIGYVIFLKFVRRITKSYTLFLTILSFICIFLKYKYFYKYHKEFFFTLLLLYYCYYFADIFAVRQNLSISLTLFSTIFIINKKPIIFLLVVCLSASIHSSAIFYIFAYYIFWNGISDNKLYVLISISVALGLVGIGEMFLNLFLDILGTKNHIGFKINYYLNLNKIQNTNNNPLILYILGSLKRLILIPLFVYMKNKYGEKMSNFNGYFNLYVIGNLIYFLFAKDLTIFTRASVPYLFFEIFLIGYVLTNYKFSKKKMLFAYIFMVLISFSRLNALINSYRELYVPYYSIFNDKIARKL